MAVSLTSYSSLAVNHAPNASTSTRDVGFPKIMGNLRTEQKIRTSKGPLPILISRKFHLLSVTGAASDLMAATPSPPSPAEMVKQLFDCINGKNMISLEEIISEECFIDDLSFSKPFEGKKEVMNFYKTLAASMGKNAKLKIRIIKEDEDTAWVDWHLEWKDTLIPFTRGCSLYEFSGGQGPVLRKAQIISESPIKPGAFALILLKTITSLLDEFPKAAEWFLKSPQVVLQWAQQTYSLLLAPFVDPIIASYVNLWKFTAQVLAYAISILICIIKVFFN